MQDDFQITSPISITLNQITLRQNYGGSMINGFFLPNIVIQNSNFFNNTDVGASDVVWETDDLSHLINKWTELIETESGCDNHIQFSDVYSLNLTDTRIENNSCAYGTILLGMEIRNYFSLSNVEVHYNTFVYTDGGAVTVNPTSATPEHWPILTDWNFSYNENANELGAGVFALYEFYMYALLPVTLTVTNWNFENNSGGA